MHYYQYSLTCFGAYCANLRENSAMGAKTCRRVIDNSACNLLNTFILLVY